MNPLTDNRRHITRRALFGREIEDLRWDEAAARWVIKTDHGDRITARFVNVATGPLQLQGDHGPVAFRNVRVRPISGGPDKSP